MQQQMYQNGTMMPTSQGQEYHNAYTQNIPGGTRYVEEHQVVRPGEQSSYSYSQQTTTNTKSAPYPAQPVYGGGQTYSQTQTTTQQYPGATYATSSTPVVAPAQMVASSYGTQQYGNGVQQYGTGVQQYGTSVQQYGNVLPAGGSTVAYSQTTKGPGVVTMETRDVGYVTTGEKRVVGSALQTMGSTVHERIIHEGYGPEVVEHKGFHRSESVTLTEEELKRLQWYEGHYELNPGEKIVHEKIVHEKVVEVPKYYVEEKVVEIPEYEYIDKIVEIPEKVQEEKIVHVPKIEYQERVVTVPKKVIKENVIEVPEVEYREIPIEKIVEVPEVREEVVVREVAVPQYVDVPVPEYKMVPIPQDVERQIPVGVEVISTYEYKMPKLKPRYTEIAVPIYVPRFIEVPVPAQMMDPASINEADKLAAQIASMSQKQTINLADFQKLVTTQTNIFSTIPANAQSQRLQNPDQMQMGPQGGGYQQQTYSEKRTTTAYGQQGYPAAVAR